MASRMGHGYSGGLTVLASSGRVPIKESPPKSRVLAGFGRVPIEENPPGSRVLQVLEGPPSRGNIRNRGFLGRFWQGPHHGKSSKMCPGHQVRPMRRIVLRRTRNTATAGCVTRPPSTTKTKTTDWICETRTPSTTKAKLELHHMVGRLAGDK